MKITFLSPHLNLAGGVKNILTFAKLLAERGHRINIVTQPPGKLNRTNLKLALSYTQQAGFSLSRIIAKGVRLATPSMPIEWLENKASIYHVSNLEESLMPDADIIVCTGGSDGPIVNTYGPEKGRKFVFFQHFGAHGVTREEKAVAQMPFKKLVLATWIKELLHDRFGEESTLVRCPVDTNFFYPTACSSRQKFHTVGMLYHTAPWKGVADGIKAFQIAREHVSNIKLVMFGCVGKPLLRFTRYCDFYYNPPQEFLRDIYSSCDVWVCPSRTEGFGMTSAEAMACKSCLVTTDNGGSRDFAFHNKTALVSPPQDVNQLAENITLALQNKSLRKKLASNGYDLIQTFTWEAATDILEKTFTEALH